MLADFSTLLILFLAGPELDQLFTLKLHSRNISRVYTLSVKHG